MKNGKKISIFGKKSVNLEIKSITNSNYGFDRLTFFSDMISYQLITKNGTILWSSVCFPCLKSTNFISVLRGFFFSFFPFFLQSKWILKECVKVNQRLIYGVENSYFIFNSKRKITIYLNSCFSFLFSYITFNWNIDILTL